MGTLKAFGVLFDVQSLVAGAVAGALVAACVVYLLCVLADDRQRRRTIENKRRELMAAELRSRLFGP